MGLFDDYDKKVDFDGLHKDIEDAKNNNGTGNYVDVPFGTYEVKVQKMELGFSKSNKPMLTTWFKIVDGEYKNQMVFYYQVMESGWQIKHGMDFINSLGMGTYSFETYSTLASDVEQIKSDIDMSGFEYALKYDQTDKGFKTFKITQVFDPENE